VLAAHSLSHLEPFFFMENPLIAGFVKKQHEAKLGRGAAKRLTEG
jgi:hypothetical protein